MAIAALVISLISLVSVPAAIFSAIYAHRNAASADAQVHDARRPDWTSTFDAQGDGGLLGLRLRSNRGLKSVSATIVDSPGISFATNQEGVNPAAASPVLTAETGQVEPADRACWRLIVNRANHATLLHLRVHCIDDTGESWDVAVEVRIPLAPFVL
ncbi:hypothetical protein ACIP5Y_07645 [Nocardia sp. NPDC088792]|uniref:hypothetical protein n=1 Tax=Nocardia sp. NPDC088792 TaxID=3364332 RepID=UPI0037F7DEF2